MNRLSKNSGPDKSSSENKSGEKDLQKILYKWDAIFNAENDAIFILDIEGKVIHANRCMCGLLNKPKEEIDGKYCYELTRCSSPLVEACPLIKTIKSKQREQLEICFTGKDFLVHTDPILSESGDVKGAVHVVRDITEHKKREEELKRINKKLEELNYTKIKFFSLVSHNLKSPFNGLLVAFEMLKNQYDYIDDTEKKQLIQQMHGMTAQTYDLLENLFRWAQIQIGEINYTLEEIFFKDLIESEAVKFSNELKQKNIRINYLIDPNICILADEKLFRLVVHNLVHNAIKYSHPNSEISIKTSMNDGNVELTVTDYGVGINSESLKKLFKIDQHSVTAGTLKEMGTGIGLILSKEIIALHGGKIWAESEEGKGSSFTFSLPIFLQQNQ